jgi:hypothetical protein
MIIIPPKLRRMAVKITEADKLRFAERELRMRQGVYPKWVSAGRMTQAKAECGANQRGWRWSDSTS